MPLLPHLSFRSHLDSVRAVAFLQNDLALVSASEDGTAKLWNLKNIQNRRNLMDFEPNFTFRGHTDAVTCVATSDDYIYTASVDASIRSWKIPELNSEPYASHGMNRLITLVWYFLETSCADENTL
jgi:striatin 1/3/4